MRDSYTPVLQMLGQRSDPQSQTLIWIAIILLLLPVLLLLGNYLRHYLHRRRIRAYAFEQLEKVGGAKGLTYPEQVTLEQIADASNLNNPAQLLNAIESFDRAVALYMEHVMNMPWREMEMQIERLKAIRHKADLRYLSPSRPPVSTRQLKIDQKIYSLAASKKGMRLIFADVIDIDDFAIVASLFRTDRIRVKLPPNADIWAFFWADNGLEYRFRTHQIKEIQRPMQYQMLSHGDALFNDANQELFTCAQDIELVAEWISAAQHGHDLSPNIFERIESPPTLAVHLNQLGSSSFTLSFDAQIEIDDLVRIRGSKNTPPFLNETIGRAIKTDENGIRFKLLNLDPDVRHDLLTHISSHLSSASFSKRLQTKTTRARTA